jgi:16S rRNA C967 or C1407 C5-methylase (RsmB/RsmF family)/NOL1/NOP2/fmu family ribosome biogenesis protein
LDRWQETRSPRAEGKAEAPLTLPAGFSERMHRLLGDEAAALEASLRLPPTSGLRVNTLKLSPLEFRELSPWPLAPVPWCPAGFVVDVAPDAAAGPPPAAARRPGLHPFHVAGLYYLQDPSAMAVAQALAPRPGERVLDLAAAPGGKSTHLAALLGDDGLLVANDVHGGRARELSRNLERWGARRVLVTSSPVEELADRWPGLFDAVLLDAPCSGEGMFRKTPEAIEQWSEELVARCAARQHDLLPQAARLVRPGGRLAYSTCTLGPAENEQVVARFLANEPRWRLVDPGLAAVDKGRPDWAGTSRRREELSAAVRLWPHRSVGEGHFIALLQLDGDDSSAERGTGGGCDRSARGGGVAPGGHPTRRARASERGAGVGRQQALELWRGFVESELSLDPLPGFAIRPRSDGLYALPDGAPATEGLRVLRPGLWLGVVQRDRFMPSHALALALDAREVLRSLDLGPDDPGLHEYLLGAELDSPGHDGWVLVTVVGRPIGWGRRARNVVKNHYPKGLRRPPGSRP